MSRQMLMVAVMTASLVIPASMAQAGDALDAGTYVMLLDDGVRVVLTIDEDGAPTVSAPTGVQVLLERDADNRVLDEFEVVLSTGSLAVDLDVNLDGSYEMEIKAMNVAGEIIADGLPAGLAKAEAAGGKAKANGARARAAAQQAAAQAAAEPTAATLATVPVAADTADDVVVEQAPAKTNQVAQAQAVKRAEKKVGKQAAKPSTTTVEEKATTDAPKTPDAPMAKPVVEADAEDLADAVEEAADKLAEAADKAADATEEAAEAAEGALDKAAEAAEEATDFAAEAADETADFASEAKVALTQVDAPKAVLVKAPRQDKTTTPVTANAEPVKPSGGKKG